MIRLLVIREKVAFALAAFIGKARLNEPGYNKLSDFENEKIKLLIGTI